MLISWRDRILEPFVQDLADLWLAADPDGLLLEERAVEELRGRGFDLLTFEDQPAFRYVYEGSYRTRRDRGEEIHDSVAVRVTADDLRRMPYDLLQAARHVRITLAELFPMLDVGVLSGIDRSYLDEVERAAELRRLPGPLGENRTKDFVLQHVFRVDAGGVRTVAQLLHLLLTLHTSGMALPETLAARLGERLTRQPGFKGWPLHELILERAVFLRFLEERWPHFLRRQVTNISAGEPKEAEYAGATAASLRVPGPVDIPFADDLVRPYVDTLFLEGLLVPVDPPTADEAGLKKLAQSWVAVGLRFDPAAEQQQRLRRLVETLEEALPAPEARHGQWLFFARMWSELVVLRSDPDVPRTNEVSTRLAALQARVDAAFQDWVLRRYSALYTQLGAEPTMLHHVPRALARRLDRNPAAKALLLVLDGLALDQWLLVRNALTGQRPKLTFHESLVFAWVPTITVVSRQALFAGKPPMQFAASINSTDKEEVLWRQFWLDTGLMPNEVAYEKSVSSLETVDILLARPRLRVAGLVINTIDEIAHGTPMGTLGVHAQVREWGGQAFLAGVLDRVLDAGFEVFLTADHGNVEVVGWGDPLERALSISRGHRARIFDDAALRDRVKQRFPESIEWSPIGLPRNYLALLAADRRSFTTIGATEVSHGGITLEEVIVPFVRIERTTP